MSHIVLLWAFYSALCGSTIAKTLDNFMTGRLVCSAGSSNVSYFTVPLVALNNSAFANPPTLGATLGDCAVPPSASGLQSNMCVPDASGIYCFQNVSSTWMVTLPYCASGYSRLSGTSDPVCITASTAASCTAGDWTTFTSASLTTSAGSVGSGSSNYFMTCKNGVSTSYMYYGPSPPCLAGFAMSGTTSNMTCKPCANPSYSSFGSPSCNMCAAGYYGATVSTGQTATDATCTACKLGQYSPPGSQFNTSCHDCPKWSSLSADKSTCVCSYSTASFNASVGCPGPPTSGAKMIGITTFVALAVISVLMT